MAFVTYVEHHGVEHKVEVDSGSSVMQGAVNNSIPGIVADCGGGLACATCHCYVDEAWIARLPQPEGAERDMLECALDPQDNSRLCCQLRMTAQSDGLVIRLPKSQV